MSGSSAEKFDGLLLSMAQQQHGIEPMLSSVFSFLRRKTDFFTGASKETIESMVLNVIRKEAALAEKDMYEKKQKEMKVKAEKKKTEMHKAKEEPSRFEEILDDEEEEKKKEQVKVKVPKMEVKVESKKEDTTDEEKDDGPGILTFCSFIIEDMIKKCILNHCLQLQ